MIDLYCERVTAEFWAEPLNAITNIAFFVAAYYAAIGAQKHPLAHARDRLLVTILCGFIALIGAGSFLFHSVATPLALLADVIPILLFQLLAIYIFWRSVLEKPQWYVAIILLLFILVSQAAEALVPPSFLNGSAGYVPSMVMMALIYMQLRWRGLLPAARDVGYAALLFTGSLGFRSVDMLFCEALPSGTHFMWHILNAAVLFLIIRGRLKCR